MELVSLEIPLRTAETTVPADPLVELPSPQALAGRAASRLVLASSHTMPDTRPNNNRLLEYGQRVFPDSLEASEDDDPERLRRILKEMRAAAAPEQSTQASRRKSHSLLFSMTQRDK